MTGLRCYLLFEFVNGRYFGCSRGSEQTREEAIRRGLYGRSHVETELIVHPRKGRRRNPVTHALAGQEKPDVLYVAIMDDNTYQRMCNEAEAEWQTEKARVREQCATVNGQTKEARLDDLSERMRTRIRVDEKGCWLWITPRQYMLHQRWRPEKIPVRADVYGRVKYEGRQWAAHRLVYTLRGGEIPDSACLRHTCDTPACVNPAHMVPGTIEDNVRDMVERGRAAWQ